MRLRLSRRLRFFVIPIAILLFLIYYFRNGLSSSIGSGGKAENARPVACKADPVIQKACFEMAVTVSEKLKIYNVSHFLCYGTLWGALRQENLLPWESRIQFCAMSEDVSKHDEVFFMREFRRFGLKLSYELKTGTYMVTDENKASGATVEIHLFERVYDLKIVRRVGWKYRILPPSSENIDSVN